VDDLEAPVDIQEEEQFEVERGNGAGSFPEPDFLSNTPILMLHRREFNYSRYENRRDEEELCNPLRR